MSGIGRIVSQPNGAGHVNKPGLKRFKRYLPPSLHYEIPGI